MYSTDDKKKMNFTKDSHRTTWIIWPMPYYYYYNIIITVSFSALQGCQRTLKSDDFSEVHCTNCVMNSGFTSRFWLFHLTPLPSRLTQNVISQHFVVPRGTFFSAWNRKILFPYRYSFFPILVLNTGINFVPFSISVPVLRWFSIFKTSIEYRFHSLYFLHNYSAIGIRYTTCRDVYLWNPGYGPYYTSKHG